MTTLWRALQYKTPASVLEWTSSYATRCSPHGKNLCSSTQRAGARKHVYFMRATYHHAGIFSSLFYCVPCEPFSVMGSDLCTWPSPTYPLRTWQLRINTFWGSNQVWLMLFYRTGKSMLLMPLLTSLVNTFSHDCEIYIISVFSWIFKACSMQSVIFSRRARFYCTFNGFCTQWHLRRAIQA